MSSRAERRRQARLAKEVAFKINHTAEGAKLRRQASEDDAASLKRRARKLLKDK